MMRFGPEFFNDNLNYYYSKMFKLDEELKSGERKELNVKVLRFFNQNFRKIKQK